MTQGRRMGVAVPIRAALTTTRTPCRALRSNERLSPASSSSGRKKDRRPAAYSIDTTGWGARAFSRYATYPRDPLFQPSLPLLASPRKVSLPLGPVQYHHSVERVPHCPAPKRCPTTDPTYVSIFFSLALMCGFSFATDLKNRLSKCSTRLDRLNQLDCAAAAGFLALTIQLSRKRCSGHGLA